MNNRISAPYDLTELSIEELMDVRFITVLKKPGTIMQAPAAVNALQHSDIHRSGATNLPEALVMVPGLQVTQFNANNWAVTVRGFSGMSRNISGQFANKLLVLKDGRSLYTPLFSGVTWAGQDMLLDDIERIEIVRGPGATLWGANAVNGIINIVSKSAYETQGSFINVGVGTEKNRFLHLRHGNRIGLNTFYRLYGKFYGHDSFLENSELPNADDSWNSYRTGFRLDSYHNKSIYTLQGEISNTNLNQVHNIISFENAADELVANEDTHFGAHIIGKWIYQHSSRSESSMKIYYDHLNIDEIAVKGVINTLDFEFQNRFNVTSDQEVIWGAGYRLVSDDFDSTFNFNLTPAERRFRALSAFVQNENAFFKQKFFVTLGSKFEINDFTGFEMQPSLRLRYCPDETRTYWASVSRAVRTPSRGEMDGTIVLSGQEQPIDHNSSFKLFEYYRGSERFESEKVLAFELGFRRRAGGGLSWDLATFYNIYNDLAIEHVVKKIQKFKLPDYTSFYREPVNGMTGSTMGIEFSSDMQLSEHIQSRLIYSYLKMDLEIMRNRQPDLLALSTKKQSPQHMFNFLTFWDLTETLSFNFSLRYVSELHGQNVGAFINGDCNVVWQVSPNLEFSLVGQNLLKDNYYESTRTLYEDDSVNKTRSIASKVQRGFYTKIGFKF